MNYHCEVCDKIFKPKSKYKHLNFFADNEFEKGIRTKRTIENPNLFGIDKIFIHYITNHKKSDLFLAKCDLKLVFKNFNPQI